LHYPYIYKVYKDWKKDVCDFIPKGKDISKKTLNWVMNKERGNLVISMVDVNVVDPNCEGLVISG
jgi:hypothetical protein